MNPWVQNFIIICSFSIDIKYTEIIFSLKCYTDFQADYKMTKEDTYEAFYTVAVN
jgi:hypothetical protein